MENRPRITETSHIRIMLVRHGETEWNRLQRFQGRSNIVLNARGIEQAQALARALKYENITAIYSSPLQRSYETARQIAEYHPSAVFLEEEGFIEMDLGDFEGIEAGQWRKQYPDFREQWEEKPAVLAMPGGESLDDVQKRAVKALLSIVKSCEQGSTLLVSTHNFVIVTLLCFAAGVSLEQFRDFRQDTAALNIIYKDGENFHIGKINDQSHLH